MDGIGAEIVEGGVVFPRDELSIFVTGKCDVAHPNMEALIRMHDAGHDIIKELDLVQNRLLQHSPVNKLTLVELRTIVDVRNPLVPVQSEADNIHFAKMSVNFGESALVVHTQSIAATAGLELVELGDNVVSRRGH